MQPTGPKGFIAIVTTGHPGHTTGSYDRVLMGQYYASIAVADGRFSEQMSMVACRNLRWFLGTFRHIHVLHKYSQTPLPLMTS